MAKSSTSGQGRPKGAVNKASAQVREAAQEYTQAAIKRLAVLAGLVKGGAGKAESEQAQVAAIKELLDRGHGKSPQAIIPQNEDGSPWEGSPRLAETVAFLLQREAARKREGQ